MAAPIVVIPCSKHKVNHPAPADHLYTGPMFRMSLDAALAITEPWRILIMSAKYGLIPRQRMLDPYNIKLGDPGSLTVDELRRHAHHLHQAFPASPVTPPTIVSLLPRAYHELFVEAFAPFVRSEIRWHYEGCRGIGDQRHRLKVLIEGRDAA